jgi:acetylglutamate kinase
MEKVSIIKVGGNIIDNPGNLAKFLTDFAQLKGKKILVHGGGKIATEISATLGIDAKMIDGRRVTDAATLKVVTMVYAGLINKNIVANLQAINCNAIGLTGADGNSIPATKRKANPVDYGFVGDVDAKTIPASTITLFLNNNIVPVFAPITHDGHGQLLNTNADTVAAALAVALSVNFETRLMYCFEKKGVLKDISEADSVIHEIPETAYASLKSEGIIFHGMIPKLDNAFKAINQGVKSVFICHADQLSAIINEGKKEGTELFK